MLVCTRPIGAAQQVLVSDSGLELLLQTALSKSTAFDYILVQTDGSFLSKADHTAGGAGLVVWGSYFNRPPQALHFVALPLAQATDSMRAEALGLLAAARLVAEHLLDLQKLLRNRTELVFQMDNLPIIQHLNGVAK